AGAVAVVPRRDDLEDGGEGAGDAVDGDLALVHALEEGALQPGAGAVDFVGEEEIGEDGPLDELEGIAVLPVDRVADEIGGEEVGGELDALEDAGDGGGEGFREGRLADAGRTLDEGMSARKERGGKLVHCRLRTEHG